MPVKLIPFLIVVLGVDNMFVLTTAVTRTSINLPVKERIAEGLAQSGVGIFLNFVMELAICMLVYVAIQAEVIREMAVFSAVALIVDYVMEMTYFITVLSIDMHRLELSDFLTQGSGAISPVDQHKSDNAGLPRFLEIMINSVQDRQARTYTAVILIGSNYLLYLLYGKEYFIPAFCSNIQHASASKLTSEAPTTASELFWQALGARPSEAIHVHVPLPVVLFFDSFNTQTNFYTFAKASFFAAFKFVVLPISLTTFALYLLLVQLLKGTDQRQSVPEAVQAVNDQPRISSEERPQFSVSAMHYNSADVELLAMSNDGKFCAAWVAIERHVCLWECQGDAIGGNNHVTPIKLAFGEALRAAETLTHLAINANGTTVAASTNTRRVVIWQTINTGAPAGVYEMSDQSRSKVLSLLSEPTRDARSSPPRAFGQRPLRDSPHSAFVSAHTDGSVWRWQCSDEEPRKLFPARPSSGNVMFAASRSSNFDKVLVRVTGLEEEDVDAWRYSPSTSEWRSLASFKLETSSGTISSIFVAVDALSTLLVIGRSSGFVDIYQLECEKQVFTSRIHEGPVRQVRLAPRAFMQCPICKTSVNDCQVLASSDAGALFLTRLSATKAETCECEHGLSGQMATFPSVFSHTSSPGRKLPSPQGSADDSNKNLAYPLSPHALRRLSHAADRRKLDDSPRKPADLGSSMVDLGSPPPKSQARAPAELRLPSLSGEEEEPWYFLHLGSIASESRDSWDICADQLVGLRRSARSSTASSAPPLGRWEAWTCPLPSPKIAPSGALLVQSAGLDKILCHLRSSLLQQSTAVQLPFSRVRHLSVAADSSTVTVAFGNVICSFDLQASTVAKARRPSLQYG